VARGDWTIVRAGAIERSLEALRARAGERARIRIECSPGIRFDSSGAWLLQRAVRNLEQQGHEVSLRGFDDGNFALVRALNPAAVSERRERLPGGAALRALFARIGRASIGGCLHLRAALLFLGRVFVTGGRCALRPRRIRFSAMSSAMHHAGVTALPIIGLLAFLIAVVTAYQGAIQLAEFGAEIFTVELTVASMLRELGILLTAIVVAGRSGSAFTAEIGVMKMREEIDAMHTMGLDPFEVLVLPRVLALMLMFPLMTMLANAAGLVGGWLSAMLLLDLSLDGYILSASTVITGEHFWAGMLKAPVFAFLIGTTATFWGMQVGGSADSVGRLTTVSVVQSLFLVIVADAAFAMVYAQFGL